MNDSRSSGQSTTSLSTLPWLHIIFNHDEGVRTVSSVLEIRAFMSDVIGQGRIADELAGPLKVMRRYCVRFLDRVGAVGQPEGGKRHLFREPRWHMHDYWFGEALGELRSARGGPGVFSTLTRSAATA